MANQVHVAKCAKPCLKFMPARSVSIWSPVKGWYVWMLYSATVIFKMCDLLWGAVGGLEKRHHLTYCKFNVVATRVHLPEVLEQTCCDSTSKTHPRALSKTFSVYLYLFFPLVLSMFLFLSFAFLPSLSLALPLFLHLSLFFFRSPLLALSCSSKSGCSSKSRGLSFLLIWDGAPGIELHSFRHRSPKNVPEAVWSLLIASSASCTFQCPHTETRKKTWKIISCTPSSHLNAWTHVRRCVCMRRVWVCVCARVFVLKRKKGRRKRKGKRRGAENIQNG